MPNVTIYNSLLKKFYNFNNKVFKDNCLKSMLKYALNNNYKIQCKLVKNCLINNQFILVTLY